MKILKIPYAYPEDGLLINFLEINGKTLKEISMREIEGYYNSSLNLAVAMFCPNLRKLSVGFKYDGLEAIKMVFNSCQYLESIKIWCGGNLLTEKQALEMVVKYSPKSLCELILCHAFPVISELLPEELESFLVSWKNCVPQKSLSLIIVENYNTMSLDTNYENMKIIEKYIELGIIKKFKVTSYHDKEYVLKFDVNIFCDGACYYFLDYH